MVDVIDIGTLATVKFALEMLLATFLAMGIWHIIPPRTNWTNVWDFIEDFIAKFIAVFAAALVLVAAGGLSDVYAIGGFISIVGAGVTGIGIASWIVDKTQTPPSAPGPPVV